jgi:hypothetical protein
MTEPNLSLPPNTRPDSGMPAARITACPVLTVYPRTTARSPRHLGFNVEVQSEHDRINLWDWLADSGATAIREFHPEVNMRRRPVAEGAWGTVASRADFERQRRRIVDDPGSAVDWANYRFAENIPWMGIPDAILSRVRDLGCLAMVPMGYVPRMFARPLVRDPEDLGPATDERIDWEAALSAYEYYFAMIHHFATGFGCRFFMMVNEPEYRAFGYYLPQRIEGYGSGLFEKIFVKLDDVGLWNDYFRALAVQNAVMARLARLALEDVRGLLKDRDLAARLVLSGPVAGNLDVYWPGMSEHVHVCDYHQYSPHPEAFRQRFRRAANLLRGTDKTVAISEFNRQAGEMEIASTYFPIAESLGYARILMEILRLSGPSDPVLEAATMYHFHFPATHRNYKSLVYGDMNRVDWTGQDEKPSGAETQPTADELQIRVATPAYHLFRMLARHAGCRPDGEPFPVLETSLMIRDTALIPDLLGSLETLTTDRGDRLVVSILNPDSQYEDDFTLDLRPLGRAYSTAVVRETGMGLADRVTAEFPTHHGCARVHVGSRRLVQVIFSNLPPGEIGDAEIVERTQTPGSIAALGLWQTTRLRLLAHVGRGKMDLTEHNVIWESEDDQFVRVGQGGLVQRVRRTARSLSIRARLADGRLLAAVSLPPCP